MATGRPGSHRWPERLSESTDLHVWDWGRVRGSDTVHRGVMKQRHFGVRSRSQAPRKGVWPCGIGRPITSDAPKTGFRSPSWHFRTVGKSVGNCTGHPAQMAGASEEDSGTQSRTLAYFFVAEEAGGQKSSSRDRFIRESALGGIRGADLRRRAPAEAIVLRMTFTRSVARPTPSNRHSAGRASSQDGLTLSQEEGQMDRRCRHVTGTRLGQDAWAIRGPRGTSAHMMAVPSEQVGGRSDRSVDGLT
jgi:hypothetical protein